MRRGDSVEDPGDVGILHLPEHLQEVCLLRRRAETVQHFDQGLWAALHQKDGKLVAYDPGQVLACRLALIAPAAAGEPRCDVRSQVRIALESCLPDGIGGLRPHPLEHVEEHSPESDVGGRGIGEGPDGRLRAPAGKPGVDPVVKSGPLDIE